MHSVDQWNSLEPSHQSVLLPYYNADDLFPARLVGMLVPNTCVYLTVLFCTGAGYRCGARALDRYRLTFQFAPSLLPANFHYVRLTGFITPSLEESASQHPRYGPDSSGAL
jgi:hypothetical protein